MKRGLSFENGGEIEITIAPNAGACFGVVRAIKLGQQVARRAQGKPVYSLGPLIHNPSVVRELEAKGVKTVTHVADVKSGTVLLRSHGVVKELEQSLRDKGAEIVDATCPLVKKPQRIAMSLGQKGYFLIIVGDKDHPEVKGVLSYYGREDFMVTYDPEDVAKIPGDVRKVGILAQTTIEVKILDEVVRRVKEKFSDVVVYNTICDATSVRQNEALALAKAADVLVVVGGKNSSNTNKLVKICKYHQKDTHHIEDISEIEKSWFTGKRKIGVTGGASTPHEFVDKVGNHIANLLQAQGG